MELIKKNKNFRLLFTGQLITEVGNQAFFIFYLSWFVENLNSVKMLSYLFAMRAVVQLIFGLVGGKISDTYSKKKILSYCDFFSGVIVLSLAFLFIKNQNVINGYPIQVMFLTVGILSILQSLYMPAVMSIVPEIAEPHEMACANATIQSIPQIMTFVGQAIGSVLYSFLGPAILLCLDGISYIVAALFEYNIVEKKKVMVEEEKSASILEAVKYIKNNTALLGIFIYSLLLNIALAPMPIILAFYSKESLGLSPDKVGYFLSSLGLGMLLGMTLISKRLSKSYLYYACISLPLCFLLLFLYQTFSLSLICMLFAGFSMGIINVFFITKIQLQTPALLTGRIISLIFSMSAAIGPLAYILGGVVIEHYKGHAYHQIFLLQFLILSLSLLPTLLNKGFRQFVGNKIQKDYIEID